MKGGETAASQWHQQDSHALNAIQSIDCSDHIAIHNFSPRVRRAAVLQTRRTLSDSKRHKIKLTVYIEDEVVWTSAFPAYLQGTDWNKLPPP